MRASALFLCVSVLTAVSPGVSRAQSGSTLDTRPFKDDAFRRTMPPSTEGEAREPSDGTVTSAPLPPPDPNVPDDRPEPPADMVPNPLGDAGPKSPPKTASKGPAGQPRRGTWVQMNSATLQALDKINARVETITVKSGETGHFGSLDISVRGCFVRPLDQPADATAFLVIRDQRADAPGFSGWMVKSLPSMSMMAHPIYDVRVAGCAP